MRITQRRCLSSHCRVAQHGPAQSCHHQHVSQARQQVTITAPVSVSADSGKLTFRQATNSANIRKMVIKERCCDCDRVHWMRFVQSFILPSVIAFLQPVGITAAIVLHAIWLWLDACRMNPLEFSVEPLFIADLFIAGDVQGQHWPIAAATQCTRCTVPGALHTHCP